MLRLLFSSNSTSQFIHRIEMPISYSGLLFRLTGTNGATQVALRDLGRARFSIRQQPVVDADMDFLIGLANLWYGSSEFSSTASGAFRATIFIPRTFIDDKNVERVTKADAAVFETTFTPNLVARIASGFLAELYAVVGEGPQSYNLNIFQQAYPSVAANQVYPDDISTVENVCAAYLSDTQQGPLALNNAGTLSGISRVRARKGDVTTDVSLGAMLAYTAQKYRLEGVDPSGSGAGNTMVCAEILGLDGSDLSARLEDKYQFTVQTGGTAAVPQILTVGFKPNPDRLGESAGEISDRLQRAKRDKAAANKTRALSFLDTVAGV